MQANFRDYSQNTDCSSPKDYSCKLLKVLDYVVMRTVPRGLIGTQGRLIMIKIQIQL